MTRQAFPRLNAIGLAVAAFTLWVLADTSIKLAGRYTLPAYEVVAFLGASVAILLTLHALWLGQIKELWPKRPQQQLLRSCLDLGNCIFVVVALRHLPLTLFYLTVFTAPMVIAILAAIFLREALGWRRLGAIVAGFAGVLIGVDPFRSSLRGDWMGFAACAVCVSCICFFVALKHTSIANVSQYHYTQMISGGLLSYVVFGEKPTVSLLIGGALIVASGV